jgi:acetyl esterase
MGKQIIIILALFLTGCNKIEVSKSFLSVRNGAAFIKNTDVVWASPQGFDLTMDIYVPNSGKASYPTIIMFHGGGWLLNDKRVLNDASAYLASNSEYIVCNVNFRNLGDLDNSVKMNEIVEDGFGAVLWVKDNIAKYKGDPNKIAVSGDSSGGHLAMMVLTQGHNLSSEGFSGKNLGFKPTYLPEGISAEQIAKHNGLKVQAAILSYGVFDVYDYAIANGPGLTNLENSNNDFWQYARRAPRGIFGDEINIKDHPNYYKQVSPTYTIPASTERKLPPMLFAVGTKDYVTPVVSVKKFTNLLFWSGHRNFIYWENVNKNHAYLEDGRNPNLGTNFIFDAPPALEQKIKFLNKIFY